MTKLRSRTFCPDHWGILDDLVMADYHRYGFCDVLEKPYALDRVARVIRGVLSAGQKMMAVQ